MIYFAAFALAVAILVIAGAIYQQRGAKRDKLRFPPPGEVRAGFHIQQRGSGAPPVLLEAGIAATSASWKLVFEPLSELTQVTAYDRAGFGWSDVPRTPRTMAQLVEDLREAMDLAGLNEPAIVVAHSFGGMLLRHFVAKYPERIRALVLADPLLPFEWYPLSKTQAVRLRYGRMLSRRGATLARIGVVRFALSSLLSGSVLVPKLFSNASSGPASKVTNRIVGELRKLPPELWPVMAAHWCLPQGFRTLADYLDRLPENSAAPIDDAALRDVPLIVISAERTSEPVIEGHRALADLSSRGRHVIAEQSGHWVQLDRPDAIVDAVKQLMRETA